MVQGDLQSAYDPVKAHAYYERTKQLKGRTKGAASPNPRPAPKPKLSPAAQKARARVGRLKSAVQRLTKALSAVEAELASRRQTARKKEQQNSDGKTTVKERQASQDYRDKHKQEIASKREQSSDTKPKSSSHGLSDMSVQELQARETKIRSALKDAKRQLSNATQKLGQLAHSDLASEPELNAHFAQFR